MSSASRLFIISRARHVLYVASPSIQNREYLFWNWISIWNVSSVARSLIMARGRHGHFEWIAFDTEQRFFLCQVLQGCLLFLGLDMFFMLPRLRYRTENIYFETEFLSGMSQVLQGHLLWLRVSMSLWVASLWYRLKVFFILKSIFSLNLSQVLQGCLLFLR